MAENVLVPLDVPRHSRRQYIKNHEAVTHGTGSLVLLAGDQRIEHLNDDFYGEGIHSDDADPEHLFRIASQARIGVFATQLGTIARYGMDYRDVQYLVKLNSKTNLVKTKQMDPLSRQLVDVSQVVEFAKESGLHISAVGYTVYLGSDFEAKMLREASQIIFEAHQHGLLVVLWMYPRGKAVADEKDPHLIAGATGVACCLGADFVKVNYPRAEGKQSKEIFREAVVNAGRTKVVCAGGSSKGVRDFLQDVYDQIDAGSRGTATGRNLHQKSLDEAVRMADAIFAIVCGKKSVDEAMSIYEGQ